MVGRKIWIRLIKAKSTLLFVGLLAGSLTIGQVQAAPFTMVCKSGGRMKLNIQQDDKALKLHLRLNFNKASRGANNRQPGPGQCAWPHRPLNNKENSPLYMTTKGGLFVDITAKGHKARARKISTPLMERLIGHIGKPHTVFSMVVSLKHGKLHIEKLFKVAK